MVHPGDTFVGIKGEKVDGNNFLDIAFDKGAIACIVDKDVPQNLVENYKDKVIIQVSNTIKSLQEIASFVRLQYNIPVVAITGSVGKTSTKDIIASVISQNFDVLKTEGNLNNHIGLPLTILNLKNQTALVVEMGMNNLGEISLLSKIAKPTIAVITNVGTSHIGNLGSRENILKAKLEILDGLLENGKLIINNDNDLLHNWYQKNMAENIYTYGIKSNSTFVATNIFQDNYSSTFTVDNQKIKVAVSGKHFIYNALSAYAVGKMLNIADEKIIKGIAEFKLTAKRMEFRKISNNSIVIEDYYNASYESILMALDVLENLNTSKKIAVLGDILELGIFSEKIHKELGKEVKRKNVNVLITVGDAAKNIAEEAKKLGLQDVYICNDNKTATKILKQQIIEDSAILIKASHGMKFEEIAKEIK